jgi:hypothetical protein
VKSPVCQRLSCRSPVEVREIFGAPNDRTRPVIATFMCRIMASLAENDAVLERVSAAGFCMLYMMSVRNFTELMLGLTGPAQIVYQRSTKRSQ